MIEPIDDSKIGRKMVELIRKQIASEIQAEFRHLSGDASLINDIAVFVRTGERP